MQATHALIACALMLVTRLSLQMCGRLQEMRQQSALVDLDIVCEEQHLHVHKVILAGASKFFREQLCKANVMVPVILRLEDFGIEVSSEALGYMIEFVYR